MKALQLHYTSCRAGRLGSAGFQVRTATPGLSPEEQREIERKGVYRPPQSAPPSPSPEELSLDEHFPRAFRSYGLSSGRKALTLSCYSGKDYTGRWGNFFAHTLVLDAAGTLPRHWPVDFGEWCGWKRELAPEEDTEETPAPLASVDLGSIEPAESYGLEELRSFLREAPERRDLLVRMARALLVAEDQRRPLVLRATPLDGVFWVAALLKVFPPWLTWEMSVSTYQDDPRGAADVNLTVPGTGFTFEESERRFRFYMFDPERAVESPVPEGEDMDYPRLAVGWLAERPELLLDFYDFLELYPGVPREARALRGAAHLFAAGEASCPKEALDLGAALAFAAAFATDGNRAASLERLGDVVRRAPLSQSSESLGSILSFLAEGARQTGESRHRAAAWGLWERWWKDSLESGHSEEAWPLLDRLRRELRQALGSWRQELAESWLRTFDDAGRPGHPVALHWTLEDLRVLGRQPVWEQPAVREGLRACLTRDGAGAVENAVAVLTPAAEPAILVGLIRVAVEVAEPDEIGRALAVVLARRPDLASVRTRLDHEDTDTVLFGEWLARLEEAEDPETVWRDYRDEVLPAVPGFRERYLGRLAESFYRTLGASQRRQRAVEWLGEDLFNALSPTAAAAVLAEANAAVSLDIGDPSAEFLAKRVRATAERLSIRLQPDLPRLREALAAPGGQTRAAVLEEIEAALEGVGAADYGLFLGRFLLSALQHGGNFRDHERVLRRVYLPAHHGVMVRAYREVYHQVAVDGQHKPLYLAIKLHVMGPLDTPGEESLGRVLEEVRSDLVDALAELPIKAFEELDRRSSTWDHGTRAGWRELRAWALERRKSVFHRGWRRVRRIFKTR